jgi:cytoskeletal protein RodZ
MKLKVLLGGLIAALLLAIAGCASTDTANKTTTANTTTTTSNTTNRSAPTNTSTTSNTANTSTTNTSASSDTAEGGKQDFTLHNQTGVEINSLYVSPHDKDEWGEDILGQDTLADGQSVEITFSPKEKAAMWDLKVTDSKDNSIEWENLNLMEISEVTLHYSNGKGTAEVK